MSNVDIQYIGKRLLERGFKDWFLFFFKQVEKQPFIIENIHEDLFNCFEDIYNKKTTRQIINISPRSAKTTLTIYFIAYCLAKNMKCNFIYTSFSQDLLNENSRRLTNILSNTVYTEMYINDIVEEEIKEKSVDEFWDEYYKNNNNVFKFTNRKITTNKGGCVLFNSMGSSITGFGCGIRGSKTFSGALILDDPNKPADVRSINTRKKVLQYFKETLLSRLNNPDVAIINIQQRLHIEDLTGQLLKEYDFNLLKKPLIENGECQLPNQYDEKRIEELKKDNYLFSSQYQQEPIADGGNIIKTEWIKRYSLLPRFKFTYICVDSALKTSEQNDYTVFGLFGRTNDNDIYLIDLLRGKWEAPDLLDKLKMFWDKYRNQNSITKPFCVYIEDKASGTGLIQQLKRLRVPVKELKPIKDKVQRLQDVLPLISSGYYYIPEQATWLLDYIEELEGFPNGSHDDMVDVTSYGLRNDNFITIKDIL